MQVKQITTHPSQPLIAPFRSTSGITLALRWGDVLHPLGKGDWFNPPYFKHILRFYCPLPLLPFISWRFGKVGGYLGAKAYGADSDAYKNWMPPQDVYPGSVALQFSIRLYASLEPGQ